jgi:hypothetical protein
VSESFDVVQQQNHPVSRREARDRGFDVEPLLGLWRICERVFVEQRFRLVAASLAHRVERRAESD